MPIKLLIPLICGVLFWLGGRDWGHKAFRRVGISFILALYLACALKIWWLFLACGIGYALTICLGYGSISDDDPKPSFLAKLLNDKVGWLTRGVYGLLVSGIGTISLVLGGFIVLPLYVVYVICNFVTGAILCKIKAPAIIIEPMVGLMIGSIVLFV